MKRAIVCCAALAIACFAPSAFAQNAPPAKPAGRGQQAVDTYCWNGTSIALCSSTSGKAATYTPLGCLPWQAITTGSAVALSAFSGGIPAGATLVDIVPSVAVVLRDDGSAPTTAGPGIPIQPNTIYPYSGTLTAAQFIAQTTSGTIAACFYK